MSGATEAPATPDRRRSSGAHGVGDAFVDALEAASEIRRLYPVGHPRSRDSATALAVAARRLAVDGEGRPILVLRGSIYLGPDLLPGASLRHGDLIDELVDAGIASIEVGPDIELDDAELLVSVLRGERATTSAFRALHLNRVEVSSHVSAGSTSDRARQLVELPLAYLRGVAGEVRSGRGIDGATAQVAAARLARHVRANPDLAVLLTAAQVEHDDLLHKCLRVTLLSARVAREFGWGEAHTVELVSAALLYDVGLMALPDELLQRSGPLTPADVERIEQHPVTGAAVLFAVADELGDLPACVALEHHRRPAPGGYPGNPDDWNDVPFAARIIGALDTYTAMTADRPYRAAERPDRALAVLRAGAPDRFDPDVVAVMHRVLGAYPIGSAVRLNTGEVGLVVTANPHLPTQPCVRVLRGADGNPAEPVLRDLSTFDGLSFPWEVDQVLPRAQLDLDLPTLLTAARHGGEQ